jgi:hypothetical protein
VPSSSNPSCGHANLIEENSRLKTKLAKGFITCIQGEKNLNDLLSIQRMNMGKEGIGFVAESSKKKNKKKKHVAPPTPYVSFDICCTKEEWTELKGKKKVKVTGVSGAKGLKSSAVSSSQDSPTTKTRVFGPTHNNFGGKYNPHCVLFRDYYGDVYDKY